MDFLTFGLNQKCTHWAITGVDGYNEPTFAEAVQLDCRWEDRVEKLQSYLGEEFISRSRIFLSVDIADGDYLALGDHTGTPDPRVIRAAFSVKAWRKTPSLDGTFFERKAYI